MKQYWLLPLAFAAAISTSANAINIKHGKVIKHKEWTTDGVKGSSTTFTPEIKSVPALKRTKDGYKHYFISSDMLAGKYNTGESVTIESMHSFSVINESQSTNTYTLIASTCVQFKEHFLRCAYYMDEIELEPNGSFTLGVKPAVRPTFTEPGTFAGFGYSILHENHKYIADSGTDASIIIS